MTSAETAFTVFLWTMTAFLGTGVVFAFVALVLMWRNR